LDTTLEYDLAGNLIEEWWGEKDESGKFIYDNLPGYTETLKTCGR
jgi:hypothetical protein